MRDVQLLVLTALAAEPMNGHRIRSEVEDFSGRPVGPGTLYGAIGRLEDAGLIEALAPTGRRRPYRITDSGRLRLRLEAARARRVAETAERRLEEAAWTG